MNMINRRQALKATAGTLLAGAGISANRAPEAESADGSTSQDTMHKPIQPPKLVSQDTVGIVSPASSFFRFMSPPCNGELHI